MKHIINKTNGNIAHIDIITEDFGVLNTYENEKAFWTSQAPIATQEITPSADYDTLTEKALQVLGPQWEIVER